MTKSEIVRKLRATNRREVARQTGIPYGYLSKLVYDEIQDPGHTKIDLLRAYFLSEEIKARRQ